MQLGMNARVLGSILAIATAISLWQFLGASRGTEDRSMGREGRTYSPLAPQEEQSESITVHSRSPIGSALVQPLEPPQPSEALWFIDKRSAVPVQGRTTGEILELWHGELMPDLYKIRPKEHPMFSRVRPESNYLGDPNECLEEHLAGILLAAFDASWAPGMRRLLRTPRGIPSVGADWLLSPLECLMESPAFNPLDLGNAMSQEDLQPIREAVLSKKDEMAVVAEQYVERVRSILSKELASLSPTRKPRHGYLFFGPFWGPPHPHSNFDAVMTGFNVYVSGGDSTTPCGSFLGSYVLDLFEHAEFAPEAVEMSRYIDNSAEELRVILQGLE